MHGVLAISYSDSEGSSIRVSGRFLFLGRRLFVSGLGTMYTRRSSSTYFPLGGKIFSFFFVGGFGLLMSKLMRFL